MARYVVQGSGNECSVVDTGQSPSVAVQQNLDAATAAGLAALYNGIPSESTPTVVTFSATPAFALVPTQEITLTGNITGWTIPTGIGDMELTIRFIQDASGSRTLAGAGGNIRLAGGALTLTVTANKCDTLTLKWSPGLAAWVEKSRSLGA